ncbi:OmpA family protein [Pseudoxanthomonas sacheonensis]|uniref:OmpA family protein n=1 Tax=Pseudoxanthomonas sacheonensis TaxID=443615 RepID=UPI0013D2965B|nr:OmpA family protein [Pseudoxanthomonas sacheonensis]KAF1706952.1 flagellar motor protein MotB [Pseudoxanthomonas sacheonensis]
MKHQLKFCSMLLLTAGAALALSACGTRHVSRDISPQGVAGEVIFPDPARIVLKGGTFPNLGDLRLVGPGMTKDQLYQLLGRPHFHEGYVGVREWDYLFHFRKDGKIITCQYKVVYDKDYIAQTFHWAPASCADLLAEAPPAVAEPVKERTFKLSADALFEFAKYGAEDILPRGREELAAIAKQLKDADEESIRIVGHTDRIGSDASNQLLSQRRAQTVREFLVDRGVTASAITAEGRGESEPVKDCEDQARDALIACLALNRRVEIQVAASSAR